MKVHKLKWQQGKKLLSVVQNPSLAQGVSNTFLHVEQLLQHMQREWQWSHNEASQKRYASYLFSV